MPNEDDEDDKLMNPATVNALTELADLCRTEAIDEQSAQELRQTIVRERTATFHAEQEAKRARIHGAQSSFVTLGSVGHPALGSRALVRGAALAHGSGGAPSIGGPPASAMVAPMFKLSSSAQPLVRAVSFGASSTGGDGQETTADDPKKKKPKPYSFPFTTFDATQLGQDRKGYRKHTNLFLVNSLGFSRFATGKARMERVNDLWNTSQVPVSCNKELMDKGKINSRITVLKRKIDRAATLDNGVNHDVADLQTRLTNLRHASKIATEKTQAALNNLKPAKYAAFKLVTARAEPASSSWESATWDRNVDGLFYECVRKKGEEQLNAKEQQLFTSTLNDLREFDAALLKATSAVNSLAECIADRTEVDEKDEDVGSISDGEGECEILDDGGDTSSFLLDDVSDHDKASSLATSSDLGKGSLTAPANSTAMAPPSAEMRQDPTDGNWYDRGSFLALYHGTNEWDAAEKRLDPNDGGWYDRKSFGLVYSGTEEWDAATTYAAYISRVAH